jgi:hypothetical protein
VGRGEQLSVARPPRPRTLDLRRRRQPGGVIPGNHPKKNTKHDILSNFKNLPQKARLNSR